MNFAIYLTESQDEKISADEFIKSIKEHGLYGYDILKNFESEDELKSKITDDAYFNKTEQKTDQYADDEVKDDDKPDKKLSEMVIRNNGKDDQENNDQQQPKSNSLSLAVRLGLKKQSDGTTTSDNNPNNQTTSNNNIQQQQHVFGKTQDNNNSKPKPQSFADKMREFADQQKRLQQERAAKEQELRDQRAKEAEQRSTDNPFSNEPTTFNGVDKSKQDAQDNKIVNKTLADIEKELSDEMFKKTRAATKVDDHGYKKVTNFSRVSDAEAERKLSREMEKKFPSKDVPNNKKLGNSDQAVEKEEHIMSRNEYSKRTLLAVSDKLSGNFNVYCKFRKLNGDIRTGNFRIGETKSQVTQKQSTIIVQDLDLSKKENKVVWRTINLFKILEIKPL